MDTGANIVTRLENIVENLEGACEEVFVHACNDEEEATEQAFDDLYEVVRLEVLRQLRSVIKDLREGPLPPWPSASSSPFPTSP